MYVTVPNEFFPQAGKPIYRQRQSDKQSRVKERALITGQTLFREGDRADYVYEVVSGVMRLTRVLENGQRQVISFGYPGDVIGFPRNGRYHTECDVISAGTVKMYRRDALHSCATDVALHKFLTESALEEIALMQDHFLMLGRKTAKEKLASFLIALMNRAGTPLGQYKKIKLPMSRSDIADFLGLTTETVSRTVSEFRHKNIIALDDAHTVIVLEENELLKIAYSN